MSFYVDMMITFSIWLFIPIEISSNIENIRLYRDDLCIGNEYRREVHFQFRKGHVFELKVRRRPDSVIFFFRDGGQRKKNIDELDVIDFTNIG